MSQLRFIRIVHSLEGRLRLRLSWLEGAVEEVAKIADQLARYEGVIEVQARPYTGSLLCRYDPDLLTARDVIRAVSDHTGVERVLQADEREPRDIRDRTRSSLASAVRQGVGRVDREIQAATNGGLDLGTTAALGFFTLGAAEIAFTGKLPLPPWFNLAWWAFRTFTMFERDAETNNAPAPRKPRRPPTRAAKRSIAKR